MKTVDEEQLAALWVQAQPTVAAFIASLVPNFHDTNDILQNVGMAAVRKRQDYDAERPFAAWAIQIAKFEVLKFRRAAARDRLQFGEELVESLGETYQVVSTIAYERQQAVQACMEKLTGQSKTAVQLRYAEGLAISDIATHMSTTPATVKNSLYRARLAVHDCVERFLRRSEGS